MELNEAWQRRGTLKNQARVLRNQVDTIMVTVDQLYETIICLEEQVRGLDKQATILDNQAMSEWVKAVHMTRGRDTSLIWKGNDATPHEDCELSTGETFKATIGRIQE